MKRGHFLLWVLAYIGFQTIGLAQGVVHLSGIIRGSDYKPLQSASIYIGQFTKGTLTDSTGRFTIEVEKGLADIGFSYVGYTPIQLTLDLQRDTFMEIVMQPLLLSELTILELKEQKAAGHYDNGLIVLRKEQFNALPAFLGENDPMRAVQMQPGIQSGNEGSRGIFVRGGSPDQNLILVDGAQVFNPSHIYGFISVFNGDAIDRIGIYKGNYPSRFGGRLGSVMDVTMDEGNNEKIKGSVTIGLVTSRMHLQGPLTKNKKTTFSFSGRACYVGLYSSPISKRQYRQQGFDGDISYYFGDINLKAAHAFTDNNKLELTFFCNNDFYRFKRVSSTTANNFSSTGEYEQGLHWANYVATLGWKLNLGRRWKLTNRLLYSRYRLNLKRNDGYREFDAANEPYYVDEFKSQTHSSVQDLSWKMDIVRVAHFQTFSFGGGASLLMFQTGKGNYSYNNTYMGDTATLISNAPDYPFESYVYLEDEIHPAEKWVINFGIHARLYSLRKSTFTSFLPRLNVVFGPVKNISFRTSVVGVSQNMHLLTTSSSDIYNDYWVPATAKARPENGWNFSLGMAHKLPLGFEWSIDGFHRIMRNLVDYKQGIQSTSIADNWEDQIETAGRGRAYGGEFYIGRTKGKITGSVAYTLAWSQRKYVEINNGRYFSYKYDRRHNVAAQVNYNIDKHFEVGVAWVYGSGNMFTLPMQRYSTWAGAQWYDYTVQNGLNYGNSESVTLYSKKNGYRLPAFHHLDVSFTYKKQARLVEHQFNLSVYNCYNRFNVFSVYGDYRPSGDGTRKLVYKKLSLFPVMPSLSYTIRFTA